MLSRLLIALALSLALHASLLLPEAWQRSTPPRPVLHVSLQAAAKPPSEAGPAKSESLLKNTLSAGPRPAKPLPQPRAVPVSRSPAKAGIKREFEAAQRKFSKYQYYPPQAVAAGIEGEVRLILILADDGSISEVRVAASSGHAILDNAAMKAAYAMGRVDWSQSRELILPVVFRLE